MTFAGDEPAVSDPPLARERERFALLAEAAADLLAATDPAAAVEALFGRVSRWLGVDVFFCYASDAAGTELRLDVSGGLTAEAERRFAVLAYGEELCGQVARERRPKLVDRLQASADPAAAAARAYGLRCYLGVPLLAAGRLTGVLSFASTTRDALTADEIELIEAIAHHVAAAQDRVRLGREARRRTDDLAASEARFRLMAEAAPVLIWLADPAGNCTWFNQRWLAFTGRTLTEELAFGWANAMHADDQAAAVAAYEAAVAARQPFRIEYRLRRHDGAYRLMADAGHPLYADGGDYTGYIGWCVDLTDQKQAAEAAQARTAHAEAAAAEAARLNRLMDEFLATVSHELRTPLNAIMGWAQMLAGPGRTDDELRDGLDVIVRNTRAQTRLVEDLLDMSRIASGHVRLDTASVNLAAVVRTALEAARPAAEAKRLRLEAAVDPHVDPVAGDAARLQQVIGNLLSNAVKFTPRGGSIRVSLERTDGHAEVVVADTGQGIAPAFLPHLFERFRQADASTTRRHGGLGIGLAIAKSLVELHGGTIRAKSPGVGQGATFVVSLPVAALPDGAAAPAAAEPGVTEGQEELSRPESLAGLRVLVVDDEPDNLRVVEKILADHGAEVTTAASADEAMFVLGGAKPHVLLTDVGMPGKDGYDLLRAARAAFGADAPPAVALTAFARTEDRVRAMRAGFRTHVAKPVDPAELVATVASVGRR